MSDLLLFLEIINIISILILSWFCFKRKNTNFIQILIVIEIIYFFIIEKNNNIIINIILSTILSMILLTSIKLYSNRINKEYNDKILDSMKDDFDKFCKK